ncbi:MAG: hypothetical protein FJ119_03825 [Deltaproteobacteria bacterium]|nr:hypothetical protein [Deltaproteobacteria bacterium]
MITQDLVRVLQENFALDWCGIHGVSHWARVRENGLQLARLTGANKRVVEAFAFVHDSCRSNDGLDPGHGLRAGKFVRNLVSRRMLLFAPDELELLVSACEHHSKGATTGDITICTCWDADRLDLGRVGIQPEPAYLCTDPAKNSALIRWAYERSVAAWA